MTSRVNMLHRNMPIIKLVAIYAFLGSIWIYFSDAFVLFLTKNPQLINQLSILKGIVFIGMTSLLLFTLISRMIAKLKKTEQSLSETEKLYRLISENTADVIWLLDIQSERYTYVSPSVEHLRGYTAEEVLSKPMKESLPPEAYQLIKDQLPIRIQQFLEGNKQALVNRTEIEQPCKDGSFVPTEVVTTLLTDEHNHVTTILGVSRNISERKRIENNLQQTMEQYRLLFKNNPIPLWVYDRSSLRILDVNDAAVHHYGYSAEEFVEMTLIDLRPPEEIPRFLQSVARNNQQLREIGTSKHRKKNGAIIDVEITTHDIDYNGMPARLVLAEDVTVRKQAEESLQESSERLRLLIEGNPDFFFYTQDTHCLITYISPSIEKITGYSVDQWLGQSHWYISDSPVNLFAKERTHRHLAGEIIHTSFSLEIIHANGGKILLEVYEHPIIRDNTVIGLHGIAHDITEQKKAELLLRQSEERFKAAFMTSPDSININRLSDGLFISINDGFTQIMGYTESDIHGKTSLDLNIWAVKEDREKLIKGLLREGKYENLETQFRSKDGTIRTGLMSASIIQLNNEPHIISITRDISEIKQLQEELHQSQKLLSIGTLAGGIAHDFNNILNIILGYTTLLEKRQNDAQKFSESITAITNAVDRGSALVRQILTFARKTDVAIKPLHVPDLIHELLSMIKQTFPKIILFAEDIDPSLPYLYADQTQLHQVLLNLCVNARDAMLQGGTLTIRAHSIQGTVVTERFSDANQHLSYIHITVEDTGHGMDEETKHRIFDPFFTTKDLGKGTGLGLAVVYGIIHAHHGFIDVQTSPNNGTQFHIYLPLEHTITPIADKPIELVHDSHGNEMILVVEDEDVLLEILRMVLETQGYTVISARDGNEAIELYRVHQQDIGLVLSDMGLPVMTGALEFASLKEINPNVKVILASGFFEPDIKAELGKAGVKDFIQKPYRNDEILQAIRHVLDM